MPFLAFITSNISNITGKLAGLYELLGEYDKSIELLTEAIDINKKLKLEFRNDNHYFGVGECHYNKGELNKAEYFFKKALELSSNSEKRKYEVYLMNRLGDICFDRMEYKQSLAYYEQSLEIQRRENFSNPLSETYFRLIRIHAESDNQEEKTKYFQQLNDLKIESRIPYYSLLIKLSKAIILKTNYRMIDKAEAQRLLREIINEESIVFILTLNTMLYLSELLLIEYKSFNRSEVLHELQELLTKLNQLGIEKKIYPVIVHSQLIQANLFLISGDLNESEKTFDLAIALAKKNNLTQLQKKAIDQKLEFESQLSNWQSLIARNASISERIELSKLEDYMKNAQKIVKDQSKDTAFPGISNYDESE